MIKQCPFCGKPFKSRRLSHIFCSRTCQASKPPNDSEKNGETALLIIELKNGDKLRFMIDTVALPTVLQFRWFAAKRRNRWYAAAKIDDSKGPQYLHRFLTNAPAGTQVDHWDHNTLNNTGGNLRVGTACQNQQNRKGANKNNLSSGIRGVLWDKSSRRWAAKLCVNGIVRNLGYFVDVEEAAEIIAEARLQCTK